VGKSCDASSSFNFAEVFVSFSISFYSHPLLRFNTFL
jgi:hypothetical protein